MKVETSQGLGEKTVRENFVLDSNAHISDRLRLGSDELSPPPLLPIERQRQLDSRKMEQLISSATPFPH